MARFPAHLLFLWATALMFWVWAAPAPAASFSRARPIMGTLVEISVEARDQGSANAAMDAAFEQITRVDELMSGYREESEVSLLKRRAGEGPVEVNPMLMEVMEAALRYHLMSGGAFDVTVGPLVRLWGFKDGPGRRPSEDEISSTRALVGAGKITLDRGHGTITLPMKGMEIDLGGIAKGYAVDGAVKSLISAGVSHGVVNAGGDLFVLGNPRCPRGIPVGIQDPSHKGRLLGWVWVREAAVATSGSYGKFFVDKGRTYSHIIDPRTGYPVQGVLSATVISPSAMQADALATVFFVMGPRRGIELAEDMPGVEALMVSAAEDGAGVSVSATSGFRLHRTALPPEGCPR